MKTLLNKSAFFILIILLYSTALGQEKINKFPLQHPESIAEDADYYYVSDLGKELNPVGKDGDGIIWKISKSGAAGDSVFTRGLNAPKGIVILNGILYTADVDRASAFDLSSGEKKFDIDLSIINAKFLNDLAVKDDSTLFVSATDINKIFIIHLSAKPSFEELILNDHIRGPNGLALDKTNNRLYVAGYGSDNQTNGEVGYIELNKDRKTFTKISDRQGLFDGIALLDENTILVSDWVAFEQKGMILKINIYDKKTEAVNQAPIGGPADFMLNGQKEIILPAMIEGNLQKFTLNK
jgi:WD40 repeat protein